MVPLTLRKQHGWVWRVHRGFDRSPRQKRRVRFVVPVRRVPVVLPIVMRMVLRVVRVVQRRRHRRRRRRRRRRAAANALARVQVDVHAQRHVVRRKARVGQERPLVPAQLNLVRDGQHRQRRQAVRGQPNIIEHTRKVLRVVGRVRLLALHQLVRRRQLQVVWRAENVVHHVVRVHLQIRVVGVHRVTRQKLHHRAVRRRVEVARQHQRHLAPDQLRQLLQQRVRLHILDVRVVRVPKHVRRGHAQLLWPGLPRRA
mmetsp:Transcript_7262/g.23246  ORF Transcript_7262/g.23246 Transcript_7262/m.23246 type:complete len:256 (-) Transcript_7262:1245-2012(-)